jgi:outer membrane protein assembly factor BamB
VLVSAYATELTAQWPQWGGPNRDFTIEAGRLADTWPEDGPKRLWHRELGDGYSSIAVDDGLLYTMYRSNGEEVVIAMKSDTGDTVWEYRYDAPLFAGLNRNHGVGPRATPTIYGDRVCTVGVSGHLHCLAKRTGERLWSHALLQEYDGRSQDCGFAASPLIHESKVIVPVGGPGHAVMAFDLADGRVVWQSQDDAAAYASPVIITVDREPQVVAFLGAEVIGLDPRTGSPKWRFPHRTPYGVNATTPIWCPENTLFVTSAYGEGSRALRLTHSTERTVAEERWHNRKFRVHFSNVIRIGDHVYGTSGDFGPVYLGGLNLRTGKLAWRKRGVVEKASMLLVKDRLVMLDETGKLVAARVSPAGVDVEAAHQLFDERCWTVPTIIEDVMYVRNTKSASAYRLD